MRLTAPFLQPLPAERYVMAEWKTVRATIDYHVEIDRHYYSVPYQLAGQQLEARYTTTSSRTANGSPPTCATPLPTGTRPSTDTCPRAIRLIWSGRPHD